MGEYASSLKTGQEVKIGTCYNMYYMTLPQMFDVDQSGMLKKDFEKLTFRLHIKEEAGIGVGEFKAHKVMLKNTKIVKEWTDEDVMLFKNEQGYVQVAVPIKNCDYDSGLYVGVKCAHGFNDQTRNEDGTLATFYNGRNSQVFSMTGVQVRDRKVYFEIECAICGKSFRIDYEEFKECGMYWTDKAYINNVIYDLQFDQEHGEIWKELIDFDAIERI